MPPAFASTNRIFHDEASARAALELLRWPHGPTCPHCNSTEVTAVGGEKRSHRDGLYQCKACRKQFTVTVGTILESTRLPLTMWFRMVHLLSENAQGSEVTLVQIQNELGLTYRTVFRVWHRICDVLQTYRGHIDAFGEKVRKYIKEKVRAKEPYKNISRWYVWRVKWTSGPTIVATGALAAFGGDAPEKLKRTEALMRLLITTDVKSLKQRRKPKPKRRRPKSL